MRATVKMYHQNNLYFFSDNQSQYSNGTADHKVTSLTTLENFCSDHKDEAEEYKRKRQLNNIAVKKSRDKKKKEMETIKVQIEMLKKVKNKLRYNLIRQKAKYEELLELYEEVSYMEKLPSFCKFNTSSRNST